MTRGGKRFDITFIDDYSRYTRVYLLRNKYEEMDAFIKYKNEVENQVRKSRHLDLIRVDNIVGIISNNSFQGVSFWQLWMCLFIL